MIGPYECIIAVVAIGSMVALYVAWMIAMKNRVEEESPKEEEE